MERIVDLFRVNPDGSVRLGLGEVSASDIERWRAREAFMTALQETAPQVMKSLPTEEVENALAELRSKMIARNGEPENGKAAEFVPPHQSELQPLFDAIDDWAATWNLAVPWLRRVAFHWIGSALEQVSADIDGARNAIEHDLPFFYLPTNIPPALIKVLLRDRIRAPGPRLLFGGKEVGDGLYWPMSLPEIDDDDRDVPYFEWNPAIETRKDNEERAVAAFRKSYRAAQDARLEEAAEQFPQAAHTKRYEHFCWLVQYQVLEMSWSEIGKLAHVSRQTVTDAVKDTAHLVGIDPLRPSARPGRKPAELSGNGTPSET